MNYKDEFEKENEKNLQNTSDEISDVYDNKNNPEEEPETQYVEENVLTDNEPVGRAEELEVEKTKKK